MKPLAPLKILLVGTGLTGVVFALCVALFVPGARTPSSLLFDFVAAAVIGLVVFGPIAGALAFRAGLSRWLSPHGLRIQWVASLLMAGALGYLLAGARFGASDFFSGLALVVLFLGAMLKVVMGIAFQSAGAPPAGGGGGSSRTRPPKAPVPRPSGGRPPVLSAAEALPKENY